MWIKNSYQNDVCTRDPAEWTAYNGLCYSLRNSKCCTAVAVRRVSVCCTASEVVEAAVASADWHGRTKATRSRIRNRSACGSATRHTCWTTDPVPGTKTRCIRMDETSSVPILKGNIPTWDVCCDFCTIATRKARCNR